MIKNSVGNITEILNLLDDTKWSGEEIQKHYAELIDRWGEWEIVGKDEAGIVVRYVDIRNAMFSGVAMTFGVFMFLSFVVAIIFGKIVFPLLKRHYEDSNEELVDITTLQSAAQINEMSKSKKEWF